MKYIMLSTPFESDDELPLMQNSHAMHSNPPLDKGLQLINNMIELNYLEYNPSSGLDFTNSGIKYMMNMYAKYHDVSPKRTQGFEELNKINHDFKFQGSENERFTRSNLLFNNGNDECPDYNNPKYVRYIKEARGDKLMPPTDDIIGI